ncbi:MAG: hypothetical protein GXY83_17055 [Rhodopirellula sp.]|nr:hypothetical protein [Rhodopirellula sp.]
MKTARSKGTWGTRFLIRLLAVAMGVLIFWLLGFLMRDIKSIGGPDYDEIEKKYVDQTLVDRQQGVQGRIDELGREFSSKRQQQQLVGESSQNLQRTIGQLLELKRLSIEKNVSLTEAEERDLSLSLTQFLESQKANQELNATMADLTRQKLQSEEELLRIEQRIADSREPAEEEYNRLEELHRLRLAAYQLAVLVPLLLAATYLVIRNRASIYFMLFLALGGATLFKVSLVVHEYFPSRYFKYILILALLAVVVRCLVYLIRLVAFPRIDWLVKQYREAYERFLCPVCEYPIRIGPRRFLYWTRRTVHKVLPRGDSPSEAEQYTCPSCGTRLFEECPECRKVRHSLLGHCMHCGAEKPLA